MTETFTNTYIKSTQVNLFQFHSQNLPYYVFTATNTITFTMYSETLKMFFFYSESQANILLSLLPFQLGQVGKKIDERQLAKRKKERKKKWQKFWHFYSRPAFTDPLNSCRHFLLLKTYFLFYSFLSSLFFFLSLYILKIFSFFSFGLFLIHVIYFFTSLIYFAVFSLFWV